MSLHLRSVSIISHVMIIQSLSLTSTYIEVYAYKKGKNRKESHKFGMMIRVCKYRENFIFGSAIPLMSVWSLASFVLCSFECGFLAF